MSKFLVAIMLCLASFGVLAQQQYVGPNGQRQGTSPPVSAPLCPNNGAYFQPAYAGDYFSTSNPDFNLTFWSSGSSIVVRVLSPTGFWYEGAANFTGGNTLLMPVIGPHGGFSPGGTLRLCAVRYTNCTKLYAWVSTPDFTTGSSFHYMAKEHTYDGNLHCVE